MILFKSRWLLVSVFFSSAVHAGVKSPEVCLNMRTLHLDDDIVAAKSCDLICKESIVGKGLIKSPEIFIKTRSFKFTGTIECSGKCFITTQQKFDQKMFKRKGRGKFVIKIDPTLIFEESVKEPMIPIVEPISLGKAAPTQTYEELNAKKEFNIEGSVFTIKGARQIEFTDAVIQGDTSKVRMMLEKYSELKHPQDITVCMLIAGLSGQITLASELIKLGANVNGKDGDASPLGINLFGQYHLITAVIAKKAEFVELLAKEGADCNVSNKDGIPALSIAVIQNDLPTVKALLQSNKIGANITERFYRYTPLMRAAHAGYKDIVEALLSAGSDLSLCVAGGATAEDFARGQGHAEIVQLLQKHKNKK